MKELVWQHEAAQEAKQSLEKARDADWGLAGATTGVFDFDMAIGGWVPSKLTTLAARSGHGKSMMLTPMLLSAGKIAGGKMAVYMVFSWEMDTRTVMNRLVAADASIHSKLLSIPKALNEEQMELYNKSIERLSKLPIQYQTVSSDITKVIDLFKRFCAAVRKKYKDEPYEVVPVALIDYINMAKFSSQTSKAYGLLDFMNELKTLAKTEGASILVLSQINRMADDYLGSRDPFPKLKNLKDSAGIEEGSDNVFLMTRPMRSGIREVKDPLTGTDGFQTYDHFNKTQKIFFDLAKHRDGEMVKFWINCKIQHMQVWSLEHSGYGYDFTKQYTTEQFWKDRLDKEITEASIF